MPYHPVNDFTPIAQLTAADVILVVHPSTPAHNCREFMEWTKNFMSEVQIRSAARRRSSESISWPSPAKWAKVVKEGGAK